MMTFGDGERVGAVNSAIVSILFAATAFYLRRRRAKLKEEERQNMERLYAQTMQMQTQMQMHQMQQGQPPLPHQSPSV